MNDDFTRGYREGFRVGFREGKASKEQPTPPKNDKQKDTK